MYQQVGKQTLDRILALICLVLSGPLWLMLFMVMGVVTRGKPLFIQPRPGRFGRVFSFIKFRTMTDACAATGELLPDADRLTPLGNWLRRTSLDELPQLLNVLTGDMSLVGPRPLLVDYWPLYSAEQHRRHEVPPGITGWAQVNGRNALTWEEKLALDSWYAANQCLSLDLKILRLTLLKLVGRSKHSPAETALMPRFTGSAAS